VTKFDFSILSEKEASEPLTHEKKDIEIIPIINKEEKSDSNSSFVGMKKISHTPTTTIIENNNIDICPTCNKKYKITQDKSMNKDSIVDWFTKYLTENKQNFTLDWLRGQKLTFESVKEMRK